MGEWFQGIQVVRSWDIPLGSGWAWTRPCWALSLLLTKPGIIWYLLVPGCPANIGISAVGNSKKLRIAALPDMASGVRRALIIPVFWWVVQPIFLSGKWGKNGGLHFEMCPYVSIPSASISVSFSMLQSLRNVENLQSMFPGGITMKPGVGLRQLWMLGRLEGSGRECWTWRWVSNLGPSAFDFFQVNKYICYIYVILYYIW